ncbi:MAG: PLP-dependent aminotransferase family protein [Ruminococcaceae bacterium]|nr:PLP-dependent aminotransferase family protein [Oscillospiraceae bacterium]
MIILNEQDRIMPMYLQLYAALRDEIRSRIRPPGSRLPSRRRMASELSVSESTVDGAYSQLLSEGYIRAVRGSGYYVCEIDDLITFRSDTQPKDSDISHSGKIEVDFSASRIDHAGFPYNQWRKIQKNCFDELQPELLSSPPVQGYLPLREEIAAYLFQARGVHCSPDQLVIGAGTDHLLQILSFILDSHYSLTMENPIYLSTVAHFERLGHPVHFVDLDDQGLNADELEGLSHTLVYITPSHQYPLGFSMPISRRIRLLNWANDGEDRFILEDDYDSEFRYDSRPIASLQSLDTAGRVIYLGSFSKAIAPSLRISYMVLPESLLTLYNERYTAFSPAVSGFEQRVLAEFMHSGAFTAHVNRMRKLYRMRRALLVDLLSAWNDQIRISGENAGHHLLLTDLRGWSEDELCRCACSAGVRVYPISRCFHGELPERYRSTVLLGYAGLEPEEIRKGVSRLKVAWKLHNV